MEKPHLVISAGFGKKRVSKLTDTLQEKGLIGKVTILDGATGIRAFSDLECIISKTGVEVENICRESPENIVLGGYSLGALLALDVARDRNMENIDGLFLLEGPLRAAVTVEPYGFRLNLINWFKNHYADRPKIAKRCENWIGTLSEERKKRIVTVGSIYDNIVPGDAKNLDGIQHYPLGEKGHGIQRKIPRIIEIFSETMVSSSSPQLSAGSAGGTSD